MSYHIKAQAASAVTSTQEHLGCHHDCLQSSHGSYCSLRQRTAANRVDHVRHPELIDIDFLETGLHLQLDVVLQDTTPEATCCGSC